jgi:hypothetical protein
MVWARLFTGVHDPIYARALVIDVGTRTALLVSTDPVAHRMIAASHDHNAPRAGPIVPGSSSAEGRPLSPPAWVKFVDDRIVEAVRNARAAPRPARVNVGPGRADINVNRNGYNGKGFGGPDLDGPSDKTVWANFEDLAGAAERVVEDRLGGNAVALWTMGPAGDRGRHMRGHRRSRPIPISRRSSHGLQRRTSI